MPAGTLMVTPAWAVPTLMTLKLPLLPEFDSPSVATAAEFVMDDGASAAMLALRVMTELVLRRGEPPADS